MALASELRRAERSLRRSVAPGVGDDIVHVWRVDPDAVGLTGRPIVGDSIVATYYARIAEASGGSEQGFGGQTTNIIPCVVTFNAGDNLDIQGGDKLRVAAKRTERLSIALLGWQPNFAYTAGQYEEPATSNGRRYLCTQSGASGATEPTWPTVAGQAVDDGSAEWIDAGETRLLEITNPGGAETFQVERVVQCVETLS